MTQSSTDKPISEADPAVNPRSRRLWRWLVGILVLLMIAPLAVIGYRYQQQMDLIERINQSRGLIELEPRGFAWLRNLVGDRRMRGFDRIVFVNTLNQPATDDMQLLARHPIRGLILSRADLNEAEARYLGEMQDLEFLEFGIDSKISEHVLNRIATLQNLGELCITNRASALDDPDVDRLLNEILGSNVSPANTLFTEDFPSGSLKPLQRAPQLRSLTIHNRHLTEDDLAEIGKLKQLESVELRWCTIPDEGVRHLAALPNLKSLNMEGTIVTDDGLKYLYGHPTLKRLEVRLTSLTEERVTRLIENLPECVLIISSRNSPSRRIIRR